MAYPIYKLTFPSGKSYIGATTFSAERRYREHKQLSAHGSTKLVHKAWRKYGPPAMEILDTAETTADLYAKEIALIAAYKTQKPSGYNILAEW